MRNIITLLTDFGTADGYAGAMKGVILGTNPRAKIIDITHDIDPQDIQEAAFVLGTTYRYFPPGTIHVIVVDPGVGSERRGITLEFPPYFFVAPDNGVLSYVLAETVGGGQGEGEDFSLQPIPIESPLRAVSLTRPEYWLSSVSSTFHGRDIFAPVAAHLSREVELRQLGEPVSSLRAFPIPRPRRLAEGVISGSILHIDRFGNLITNVREEHLRAGAIKIYIGEHCIQGISKSYLQGNGPIAVIDSSGYLEIAIRNSSAAARMGARVRDSVRIVMEGEENA